jgi:hypothetical protein
VINAELRMVPPVWSEQVDDGGMFPTRLSVHRDPDGGPLPFLAVVRTSFGAGGQARRATQEEATAYTYVLHAKVIG